MTELARVEESSLEVLPPQKAPSVAARQMLLQHAEMMDTAYKLASPMVATAMVPARFRGKVEDATAAILYGAELGLNPIQALQRVIPIHGMPSIEARTMVALLKARGYKVWTVAQSDESVTVRGRDLDGDEHESTWTIERALKAGYVPEIDERTGKYKVNAKGNLIGNEKYLTDPQAMLKAKAQAEVCRDMAPDVLMGISYTREELESERFDDFATTASARPTKTSEPVTVEEIFGTATETAEAAPDAEEARADTSEQPEAPAQPQPEPQQEADGSAPDGDSEPTVTADPAAATGDTAGADPSTPEPEQKPEKSATRKALERRLFKLLKAADVDPANREDRLIIYQAMLPDHNAHITTTDDLTNVEVAAICDQLYLWDKDKVLGDRITDILNAATLAEVAAEEQQEIDTTTEGE